MRLSLRSQIRRGDLHGYNKYNDLFNKQENRALADAVSPNYNDGMPPQLSERNRRVLHLVRRWIYAYWHRSRPRLRPLQLGDTPLPQLHRHRPPQRRLPLLRSHLHRARLLKMRTLLLRRPRLLHLRPAQRKLGRGLHNLRHGLRADQFAEL